MKYFIILSLTIATLQNCNSQIGELSEVQRNTLVYLTSPPRTSVSTSHSSPAYQTIFLNNCKTVSSSLHEKAEVRTENSYTIDDMIFVDNSSEATIEGRSVFKTGCANLWSGGVIPFEIDPAFSNVVALYSAFTTWESKTLIRFVKRTSIHRDYIYITPSNSCSSFVGRIGGAQNLNLASACSYKNMLHELGHAIGFHHEHQRQDRDNFITIYIENIQTDKLTNFSKLFPSYSFSVGYDIYSIMHYTPYAFSVNSRPTITLKDQSINFGNSGSLSALDVENANSLYKNNFSVINNIPAGYYR